MLFGSTMDMGLDGRKSCLKPEGVTVEQYPTADMPSVMSYIHGGTEQLAFGIDSMGHFRGQQTNYVTYRLVSASDDTPTVCKPSDRIYKNTLQLLNIFHYKT